MRFSALKNLYLESNTGGQFEFFLFKNNVWIY